MSTMSTAEFIGATLTRLAALIPTNLRLTLIATDPDRPDSTVVFTVDPRHVVDTQALAKHLVDSLEPLTRSTTKPRAVGVMPPATGEN